MATGTKLRVKCIVLGDSGVGKTSLIKRYVFGKFTTRHEPTVGVDFLTKDLAIRDKLIQLQLWDTAGQERFRSMGSTFYRNSDCCVLVYDVMTPDSFLSLDCWREEFFLYADPADSKTFPIIVVGNKVDSGTAEVSTSRVETWCQVKGGLPFFEVSAKTNLNVEQVFDKVIDMVADRKFGISGLTKDIGRSQGNYVLQQGEPETAKSTCPC